MDEIKLNTLQSYSKVKLNQSMELQKHLFQDDDKIMKALIAIVVEQTLLEIGKPFYEKVIHLLNEKYNSYLPECSDHPEYLNKVLQQLLGNSYIEVIKAIESNLGEVSLKKPAREFLKAIAKA